MFCKGCKLYGWSKFLSIHFIHSSHKSSPWVDLCLCREMVIPSHTYQFGLGGLTDHDWGGWPLLLSFVPRMYTLGPMVKAEPISIAKKHADAICVLHRHSGKFFLWLFSLSLEYFGSMWSFWTSKACFWPLGPMVKAEPISIAKKYVDSICVLHRNSG